VAAVVDATVTVVTNIFAGASRQLISVRWASYSQEGLRKYDKGRAMPRVERSTNQPRLRSKKLLNSDTYIAA
jgi:hypothetical protein